LNDTLLACFQAAPGEYVSGEKLSRELGISRTAVWKRIRRLEESGYRFESVPRLGYKLIGYPDRLRPEELLPRLAGTRFGASVKLYDSLESTQNAAYEALVHGAGEGALIVADAQTSGRGRLGRHWFSPPGKGIYMSFLLQPNVPLARAPQMTLLLSVAMCRAIRRSIGADATIKWPNDILIGGRKVCGILVETILEADAVKAMIAGIGVSANVGRDEFPEALRPIATSLMEAAGARVSREAVIGEFFEQFEALYELYRSDGFEPVKTLWEALSSTLHGRVRVNTPQGVAEGVAEGITTEGALLVRDDAGVVHTMYSGDLSAPAVSQPT